MIDESTNKPVQVRTAGDAEPYIMLPTSQLEAVQRLLDENNIRYEADSFAISIGGKPEKIFVNIGRKENPVVVQQVLDSIP